LSLQCEKQNPYPCSPAFSDTAGHSGIFAEILRISAPYFRNKKDFNSQFEFIPRCNQRGNSNLKKEHLSDV
jgi:hypothetical protein